LDNSTPANDQSMRALNGQAPSNNVENSNPSGGGTTNNSSSITRPSNKSLVDPEGNSANSTDGVPPLLKSNGNRNASIPSPSSFGLIPTRLIQKLPQAREEPKARTTERESLGPQIAPQPKTRRLAPLDDSGWRAAQPSGPQTNAAR
jgi:hypothetical protein